MREGMYAKRGDMPGEGLVSLGVLLRNARTLLFLL